jgi:hypothetical protein
MITAMLLLALSPGQRVPERIEAALPPVAVATRGLVNDQPRLEVDLSALFDDGPARLSRPVADRAEEAVERLVGAAQEARRNAPSGAAHR